MEHKRYKTDSEERAMHEKSILLAILYSIVLAIIISLPVLATLKPEWFKGG